MFGKEEDINNFEIEEKLVMNPPEPSGQHHTFKKRPSLMGDESFAFRRSINIQEVYQMVRRHLDNFYKIYENAKV